MANKKIIVPKKLSIPPLLKAGLTLWGSVALSYLCASKTLSSGQLNFYELNNNIYFLNFDAFPYLIIFLVIILIIISAKIFITKSFNTVQIIMCFTVLGIIIGFIGGSNYQKKCNELYETKSDCYLFEATKDQKESSYYNTCEAKIIEGVNDNAEVKLQVDKSFEEIHAGDIIQASASFNSPTQSLEESYYKSGICSNARLNNPKKIERHDIFGLVYSFRNNIINTIREFQAQDSSKYNESGAILSAIICGFRIDLNNSEIYENFKNAGLAHLVAVSGAHLSLVCAILLLVLKKLKVSKKTVIGIQSVFILSYLICAALPISALRAGFMAYIAIFSFFSKRRPAPLNALGLCIICFLVINPTTSVDVSFALSAGSTLGILLFSNLFQYWIGKIIPKCPEMISSSISLTFAANICSLPLSVSMFNQISLIAPLANVICTPLFTLLCGYGLIACVTSTICKGILPVISYIFLWSADGISNVLTTTTKLLASVPFSCIPATINIYAAIGISFGISILLYSIWPKSKNNQTFKPDTVAKSANSSRLNTKQNWTFNDKHKNLTKAKKFKYKLYIAAGLCLITIFLSSNFTIFSNNSDTELIMLDVGQGDSILIKSKGKKFLIDTGNQDSLLKQRLAENNITTIDGLMITHPDDDHCGSLDVIQSLVEVKNVYVAKDLLGCSDKNATKLVNNLKNTVAEENIKTLEVGNIISFGEVEMNVVWPDNYSDNGGNGDSVCVDAKIDVGNDDIIDANCFLCGDAEIDELNKMIEKNRIGKTDIYKVGHHGSKNALDDKQAKILSPEISLISVGAKNRYGHPAKQTLDNLDSSKIFRTDQEGSITCKFHINNIEVITQK